MNPVLEVFPALHRSGKPAALCGAPIHAALRKILA
jgi:hypothetical protein